MNIQGCNTPSFTETLLSVMWYGFSRATNTPVRIEQETKNIQCVKLTREHRDVLPLVIQWCNRRVKALRDSGFSREYISNVITKDARFLSYMAKELVGLNNQAIDHDTWLFFENNVTDTSYFEIRESDRGSNIANTSIVIQ